MHSKRPPAETYLVNGAPSWLQAGPDGLSWWPATATGAQHSRADSIEILCNKQRLDFAQVIALKRRISSQPEPRPRRDTRSASRPQAATDSSRASGTNLSQSSDSTSRSTVDGTVLSATRADTASKSSLQSNSLAHHDARTESQLCPDLQQPGRVNKIKIYYAKRSETKTTGRLLKVKKLTIQLNDRDGRAKRLDRPTNSVQATDHHCNESNSIASHQSRHGIVVVHAADTKGPHSDNNNNKEPSQSCQLADCDKSDMSLAPLTTTTTTNETSLGVSGASSRCSAASGASAPPSCYASEGSSSHLSSCSSSRDSPSPVPQPTQQHSSAADGLRLAQNLALGDHRRLPVGQRLTRLHEQLERQLELEKRRRPRRLLIFVNPFGGKGKALQLYKRRVRCLLELAGVDAKLIVTQYANHARDTIEDPLFNVDSYDGIVCVGGDGMFSELMNGLLFRYNRDKILSSKLDHLNRRLSGLDLGLGDQSRSTVAPLAPASAGTTTGPARGRDPGQMIDSEHEASMSGDPERMRRHLASLRGRLGGLGERFNTPCIPVGVIGAGSTDCNSFGLIGTNDAITATLNIILGNQIQVDVCSIHSIRDDDRLLRFVSTFIAYGYFGDVVRESEKLRWLGPSRYDVTGLNTLLRNRAYNGLVRIICSPGDGKPNELGTKCHLNCRSCKHEQQHQWPRPQEDAEEQQQQMDSLGCDVDEGSATEDEDHGHSGAPGPEDDPQLELIEQHGPFVGVNAAVMACRCPQTKKGFSPSNHLANGCADLILVRPCTRLQYINYLIRTGYSKKSAFDLKYVDAYRCRQFEFIAQDEPAHLDGGDLAPSGSLSTSSRGSNSLSSQQSSKSNSLEAAGTRVEPEQARTKATNGELGDGSSWNADGEILTEQSIRVKVNNRLLRVFGTGEPQPI